MITVEVCYVNGLVDQNLNIAKCLLKHRQTGALPGTTTWIRINPNYVRVLEGSGLILKNEENKNFVQLTETGKTIQIYTDTLNLSLEEYFAHEKDIDSLVEDSLSISITNSSYKVMHNICHCCGKVKTRLNHIVDNDNNNGMYCNQCLNGKGYNECQIVANHRRKEAQHAFSIRQN